MKDESSTGRSPNHSTNTTDRSKLNSSRMEYSNHRILTSPSSATGN